MSAAWRDRLLAVLHRVFDVDAHATVAFRVRHERWCAWRIQDETLTLELDSGQRTTFRLSDYTISELAAAIAAVPGYGVIAVDENLAGRSAIILLEGSGRQDESNGDQLYGYTSLLWALLHAFGLGLGDASRDVELAIDQVSLGRSSGEWLDLHGSYYGILRLLGEMDAVYLDRLIAQVLLPRSNNIAIAVALQKLFGAQADAIRVIDAPATAYDPPLDGGYTSGYGLFDVEIVEPPNRDVTLEMLIDALDAFRAAGTWLRYATLTWRFGPRELGLAAIMTTPISVIQRSLDAINNQNEISLPADLGIVAICPTAFGINSAAFGMQIVDISGAYTVAASVAATFQTPVVIQTAHLRG